MSFRRTKDKRSLHSRTMRAWCCLSSRRRRNNCANRASVPLFADSISEEKMVRVSNLIQAFRLHTTKVCSKPRRSIADVAISVSSRALSHEDTDHWAERSRTRYAICADSAPHGPHMGKGLLVPFRRGHARESCSDTLKSLSAGDVALDGCAIRLSPSAAQYLRLARRRPDDAMAGILHIIASSTNEVFCC